ncbi:MAG: hypothetical protein ACTHJ8_01065 [Mucilaginibacter sp.]|jgi:hypothetical protein
MSGVNEIKCPHCGQWTSWQGHTDDKCQHCNNYVEPHRFSAEAERKIKKRHRRKEDFFPLRPTDGPIQRELKGFINAMGWIVFYSEVAFYIGVIVVIAILGFVAG